MTNQEPAKTLKVYLGPEDYERVTSRAKAAHLSASKYAANILLGYEIAGTAEQEAISEIARSNTILGRLGGLLKLGLKEHPGMAELRPLLREIEGEKERMRRQYESFLERFNL